MMHLLVEWLMSALALLVVAQLVDGFELDGLGAALATALVVGLLNVTIGVLLKVVTLPLGIVTFGLFWLVINGLMLLLASAVVKGFRVRGLGAAFWGALVLALLHVVGRWFVHFG